MQCLLPFPFKEAIAVHVIIMFSTHDLFKMRSISITRPDDWHIHLRDSDYLAATVKDVSRYFGRAIVMPNLTPPVTTVEDAKKYLERINSLVKSDANFRPLMTLYLTEQTTRDTIRKAKRSGYIHAIKLYPAGATTHSDDGVRSITNIYPLLEVMEEENLLLAIHGEVTDHDVDVFDREKVFIDKHLIKILRTFPNLRVVFEHISTSDAATFVAESGNRIAATITAHHLLFNRNHLLAEKLRPAYYCLPILKRDIHQKALIKAATSGDSHFFLGTDSAPHPRFAKELACGCAAGAYTSHAAIELYAEIFDQVGCLDKLEAFASHNGPDFYELPRNSDRILLTEKSWEVPSNYTFGDDSLVPVRAGELILWTVTG